MSAQQYRSAADVIAHLNGLRQAEGRQGESSARREAYLNAAAVLGSISDLDSIQPIGIEPRRGEAAELLRDHLVVATPRSLPGQLMLAPEARRRALHQMGSRDAMLEALSQNTEQQVGDLQLQLGQLVRGESKSIDEQSPEEIDNTLQILLWMDDVLDDLPDIGDVRRRRDFLELMRPLQTLAGDEVFKGRTTELDQMRRYVGIVPPASLLARLADATLSWIRPDQQPALSVYGPGGVGKSALLARFMLEHMRLPERARVPFAYLDFDRPALDISDPVTLCAEMVRQLVLQFPEAPSLSVLSEDLSVNSEGRGSRNVRRAFSILRDLLGIFEKQLGPRPYVVVLDTFEQVQLRGEGRAYPFWEILSELQGEWPFLRVVISGRAEVASLRLASEEARRLPLGDLDDAAAVAFLAARGVRDARLAKRLVAMVGGVPLSLKLVASVVNREAMDAKTVATLHDDSTFWKKASDEVVQGYLYDRILGQLGGTPDLQSLALPGLVLRRITPDVILQVLKGPCELAVDNLQAAKDLLAELAKQTSLVSEDREGVLVHRSDLRRTMLKLLIDRQPAKATAIHEAAVRYYGTRTDVRSRAETLYHQLMLGRSVSQREATDPEVKSSLSASVGEMPLASQVLLASYGFGVSQDVLEQATQEQFDAHQAAQVEELLAYGASSVVAAARMLRDFGTGDRPSPLFRARARVALQQGNQAEASEWLERGLVLCTAANRGSEVLGLLSEKAWQLQEGPLSQRLPILDALARDAERFDHTAFIVQALGQSALASRDPGIGGGTSEGQLRRLGSLLLKLRSRDLWGLVPLIDLVSGQLIEADARLPEGLAAIIHEEESAFLLASLVDERSRRALDDFLGATMEWTEGVRGDAFVRPWRKLADAWPYKVLHVPVPYGRSRSELVEA
jgi:hypothetical protein